MRLNFKCDLDTLAEEETTKPDNHQEQFSFSLHRNIIPRFF